MAIQYYQPNEKGKILSVMNFESEADVNDWVKNNCVKTTKNIIQLFDGSYEFEENVDWQAEEEKKLQAQYEQLKNHYTGIVQSYMDEKAQERGYDNIHTACSYANSTDEVFRAEGQACLAWRDAVWRKCYGILDEVTAGTRPVPTDAEVVAELPVLEW